MTYPIVKVARPQRLRGGSPWGYSNEIVMTPDLKQLSLGNLVRMEEEKSGKCLGIAFFNPHSLICLRLLTSNPTLSETWIEERLIKADHLRSRLIAEPFYRMVHAEVDGLPGLIVDRFGDIFVVQCNTAGMDQQLPKILEVLQSHFQAKGIVLRNDSPARSLEGLPQQETTGVGDVPKYVKGEENGVPFLADVMEGQKTGWFYDQRDNRSLVRSLAKGLRVLDCYSYVGSFSLYAAAGGAAAVTLIDRSRPALDIAREALQAYPIPATLIDGEAFQALSTLSPESFDIVILDPPTFVKSRKDIGTGLKGYEKLVRLASPLVVPGGFLMLTSCSHHVDLEELLQSAIKGLWASGRSAKILKFLEAGPDHPVHPFLIESRYLKGFLMMLD